MRFKVLKFRPLVCCFLLAHLTFWPSILFGEEAVDKYGGHLVRVTTSDPKTFNDLISKETTSSAILGHIFEGLTTTDAFTLKVKPHLAESWDVSEDGLTWTFHLRQDVRWHDGKPFTADDVVFTYNELVYNPEIPASVRDIFTIDGQQFEVSKIDDYTVQFVLPVRFAPFLRGLSQSILPKHLLEKSVKDGTFNFMWKIDADPKDIVGTGPYKLAKYVPGQRLVLEKNAYYWMKSPEGDVLPYIDKITFVIVQSGDVALLKFLEGTVDAINIRGMDYPLVKPLEAEKNFTVYDMGPDTSSNFIVFNQNQGSDPQKGEPFVKPAYKLKWFTNPDFRRAVAHAVDKERIIEVVMNGLGYPQHAATSPAVGFFHNPDVRQYEYDLDKAREFLKKAGFTDKDGDGFLEDAEGHPLEFSLYTSGDLGSVRGVIAGMLRHDLEQLGMKV
ncbi:MAG: ABC transporter substrate-binding protein, partial [Candidatus Omnitrophica bacterium]|nr:ABC transporter substrate-binding protein [Candidatus Omnitrophota bacterium]